MQDTIGHRHREHGVIGEGGAWTGRKVSAFHIIELKTEPIISPAIAPII